MVFRYVHRSTQTRWGVFVCWALLTAGCVTVVEEMEPLATAKLVVSRAGNEATLQFASERGVTYQILYAGSRDPRTAWQKLPGAERVQGTGSLIEFKDRIPYRTPRYYRLKVIEMVQD